MNGHTVTSDATLAWFWSGSGICALPDGLTGCEKLRYELRVKAVYRQESVFKNEAQKALRYAENFVHKAEEVRK